MCRTVHSDEQASLEHAGGAEVSIPPLDRMFLDEAVAAEQLYALGADGHARSAQSRRASVTSRANGRPWSTRAAAR